jgi:phosphoglycerate dehydrogenase-like enzyme
MGAEVRVHDPYIRPDDPLTALTADLLPLMRTSDVVAVHAPATPETQGMIGADEIAAMRDGTRFVNTARPSIVDMDALFDAVASGRIDAALDVFDSEPLPVGDRWRGLPNVLLTPHIAGATADSRQRAGRIVVAEIRRHLAEEPLEHALTREDLARMG